MKEAFVEQIVTGYPEKDSTIHLGSAMLHGEVVAGAPVHLNLKTFNRHGLIAGATGTGKTKTLQLISELLSEAGVPVMALDIKGDLSGLAAPGTNNEKIEARAKLLEINYQPSAMPVELLSLGEPAEGVTMRSTVIEFGPILLSKVLALNDTQAGLMAVLFKYADDRQLPLVDLSDIKRLLQYAGDDGKSEIEKEYGKISTSTTGTILRKVIELEQQGANKFFGEPSFDVRDLMRIGGDGRGVINILRVMSLQDRPKLFSTFMLQLLAELYAVSPELGDVERPELVMFIDEAHLIFKDAGPALLEQIETVVKLIRSKGIGVFFCTQNPTDIPPAVLAQLGLKVQHALRAFTANDRKAIKQTAENYPLSDFYETETLLTSVGIGEALLTGLNEKGIPTPLVHVMLAPPRSRMNVLTSDETAALISKSPLHKKYGETLDPRSAAEILEERVKETIRSTTGKPSRTEKHHEEPGMLEKVLDNSVVKSAMKTAANSLTRSLLGALGLGGRGKSRSLF